MKHLGLISVVLFLSGCAHNSAVKWMHPERDFKEDRLKCVSTNPNNNFAQIDCLKKLGWKPLSGDILERCEKVNSNAFNMVEKAREDYTAFKKKIYGDKFEEFVKRYELLYANRKKLEKKKITLEQFNQALKGDLPIDNLIR